jgi:hypothetical protein
VYIKYNKTSNYITCAAINVLTEDSENYVAEVDYNFTKILLDIDGTYNYKYENNIITELAELDKAKQHKIYELSKECEEWIYSGFDSKAFDGVTSKHYDFSEQDQGNIKGQLLCHVSGVCANSIKWKASGELLSYSWSIDQFKALVLDAKIAQEEKMLTFHNKRVDVLNATTIAEVEAITLY